MTGLETLNTVDMTAYPTVAHVSSKRAASTHWTELRIVHTPDKRRAFLCEIYGGTTIRGQHNRRRRRAFDSLQDCFDFFDPGGLSDAAMEQASEWVRKQPAGFQLKNKTVTVGEAMHSAIDKLAPPLRFDPATGITGALAWLYSDRPDTQGVTEARFELDFGIPARTLRHALKTEADGAEPTSWAKAFVAALRFFDLDGFRAGKVKA